MKKSALSFLAILAFSSASLALACTKDGREGIFPENDRYIPAHAYTGNPPAEGTNLMTEASFMASIARAEKIYSPVFVAQGRVYKIFPRWTDGTVNAYAKQNGNASEVYMFGGLARHPKMTTDAFELVICHETGHHLGGAPKSRSMFGSIRWASNEGEADYFSTLKCAREMWKTDDNEALISKMNIPSTVIERCQKSFDQPSDLAICKRSAIAGKALGDTLSEMNKGVETEFDKPDAKVVTRMYNAHPEAQCRLDTYFAGAVCPKSKDEVMSDTDPRVGACSQENGDTLGVRPLCWYVLFDPNKRPSSAWPSSGIARR